MDNALYDNTNWLNNLIVAIENHSATIGIIGLGYVGLPLAVAFSKKYNVIGYNKNVEEIEQLKSGRSYIEDVKDEEIDLGVLKPTSNHKDLISCDFIIITVPTPLSEDKKPDLSYIKLAAEEIADILQQGQFIILKSTTYPGTTEEYLVPILEKNSKLGVIQDFGVAYSPERIDPGNKKYSIQNTPNVVGGLTQEFTDICAKLFLEIVDEIITVNDCKTAEAVKMIENIFRNVNIALVNEMALIFEKMDIDIWEVIESAKTKPYGYMPFYPGPGVGGHCIPLDPYYLSYRAKHFGIIPRFIEAAGEINDYMPVHTVNLAKKGLKKIDKTIRGSNILILGLSYKEDIGDCRESPAIKIIEELSESFSNFKLYDPYVRSIKTKFGIFYSENDIIDSLKWADCIIIITGHRIFQENSEMIKIMNCQEKVIVDTRNVFDKEDFSNNSNYIKL